MLSLPSSHAAIRAELAVPPEPFRPVPAAELGWSRYLPIRKMTTEEYEIHQQRKAIREENRYASELPGYITDGLPDLVHVMVTHTACSGYRTLQAADVRAIRASCSPCHHPIGHTEGSPRRMHQTSSIASSWSLCKVTFVINDLRPVLSCSMAKLAQARAERLHQDNAGERT